VTVAVTWLTPDEAGQEPYWPTCPVETDALAKLLEVARTQCEAFAPALADGADVPENYRLAQARQAQNAYRAGQVDTGGSYGVDDVQVTVFPLDWHVKALLRPPTTPVVG